MRFGRRTVSSQRRHETIQAYTYLTPILLVIAAFALAPLWITAWKSLYAISFLNPGHARFIGLANYRTLVVQDPRFRSALFNTLWFTLVSVSLELVLGMVMALAMHRAFKGRGLLRAAVLVPWAIPTVVSARMWGWMYHDKFGVLNDILVRMHLLSKGYPWLADPHWAMPAVIFADVWKTAPFMALLLLAGLQMIREELYEAARIDGAGAWRQFWHVTLPLIRLQMMVALVFRTMDALRVFDLPYVLTGGASNTETLTMYNQNLFFVAWDYGKGAAASVLQFLLVALFSALYFRLLGQQLAGDR